MLNLSNFNDDDDDVVTCRAIFSQSKPHWSANEASFSISLAHSKIETEHSNNRIIEYLNILIF